MRKSTFVKSKLRDSAGDCEVEARLTFLAFRDNNAARKDALIAAGQRREAALRAKETT